MHPYNKDKHIINELTYWKKNIYDKTQLNTNMITWDFRKVLTKMNNGGRWIYKKKKL